ncbi:sodium-dependent phosphate transporter 1-B-like isoform X2 [Lineus longissimus]|uniref:sodium-dependent phosphate transporter 1-B-like isoform X2 n=1 Tax=Lineus longissimus TaxID=88925 RepID=UPI00315DBF30
MLPVTTLTTITTIVNNGTMAIQTIPTDEIWIVIAGFVIAFVLAFGIGANDVANSFATSVGAKVLTLLQACILASVFETVGGVLIGAKVSDTIRKGIIDVTLFAGQEKLLLVGNVAALAGACVWLLIATIFKMPVSGTHSIVGASLGYALVAFSGRGIRWIQLLLIVSSWFISPLLAGGASVLIFAVIRRFILDKDEPLDPGLLFLPFIYALTVMINVFSIFQSGTPTLGFDNIPLWGSVVLTVGAGLIVGVLVRCVVVPRMRVKVLECDTDVTLRKCETKSKEDTAAVSHMRTTSGAVEVAVLVPKETRKYSRAHSIIGVDPGDHVLRQLQQPKQKSIIGVDPGDHVLRQLQQPKQKSIIGVDPGDHVLRQLQQPKQKSKGYGTISTEKKDPEKQSERRTANIQDRVETKTLFTSLQILTAIFGSFAHGGNDVSNAIGPLVGIWLVSTEGSVLQESSTPLWLLAFGGVGICAGLWVLGSRVIETLGEDLTKVTPSSGFCIETGTALTVLIASNIGIPISTTHCKVGSVVCTGRFRSKENVDWTVFRNIVLAWIVTLPVSGLISAAIFAGLRELV